MRHNLRPRDQLTVGIGLVTRNESILLRRRFAPKIPEYHDKWELPGGKIEPGESVEAAVEREVLEETGYRVRTSALLPFSFTRSAPDGSLHVIVLAVSCDLLSENPVPPVGADASQESRWFSYLELPFDALIPGSREFVHWWLHNHAEIVPPSSATEYRLVLERSPRKTGENARYCELILSFEPGAIRPYKLIRTLRRAATSNTTCYEFPRLTDAAAQAERLVNRLRAESYEVTGVQDNHPLRSWIERSTSAHLGGTDRQISLFDRTRELPT